jgi:hypothetical protein
LKATPSPAAPIIAEIVGAVADHQGFVPVKAELVAQLLQRLELGIAAQYRFRHDAGKAPVVSDDEAVAAVLVEPDLRRDLCRKFREAARHQAGIGTVAAHRMDQSPPARRQGDPSRDHLVNDAGRKALEHGNALAKGRGEFDLAAHGALGNGSDAGPLADEVGQFIDAFLADHGGVHVGEEQAFAPSCRWLHHHVNRGGADGGKQRRPRRFCHAAISGCAARCGRPRRKRDIQRQPAIKPGGRALARQDRERQPFNAVGERSAGMCDQGGNVRHRMGDIRLDVVEPDRGSGAAIRGR